MKLASITYYHSQPMWSHNYMQPKLKFRKKPKKMIVMGDNDRLVMFKFVSHIMTLGSCAKIYWQARHLSLACGLSTCGQCVCQWHSTSMSCLKVIFAQVYLTDSPNSKSFLTFSLITDCWQPCKDIESTSYYLTYFVTQGCLRVIKLSNIYRDGYTSE